MKRFLLAIVVLLAGCGDNGNINNSNGNPTTIYRTASGPDIYVTRITRDGKTYDCFSGGNAASVQIIPVEPQTPERTSR